MTAPPDQRIQYLAAPAGILDRAGVIVGEPVVGYAAVVLTESGNVRAYWPSWQDPRITADLAADLACELGIYD